MMRLSQYVQDPLTVTSDTWWHPITDAKVKLSPALKAKLPSILRADLDQEGRTPDEILNQFIAAELRDLGFLLPAHWVDTEERFFALHGSPRLTVAGLLGLPPQKIPTENTKAVLLTMGRSTPLAFGLPSPLLSLRQATNARSQNLGQVEHFNRTHADLGHLVTDDLTPDETATLLKQWLPLIGAHRLPIILMDHPASLPGLILDPNFWPTKAWNQASPWRTIIADTTLRCSSGLPKDVERRRSVSAFNLFAHLEWKKRPTTPPFTYLLPTEILSGISPNEMSMEVLGNNCCLTETDEMQGITMQNIGPMAPTPPTAVLWVIHGTLFARDQHLALRGSLLRQLSECRKAHLLKGLVIWGLNDIPVDQMDLMALEQALIGYEGGLS